MSGLKKIRVGVVGYGLRGKEIAKNILADGSYQIMAVSDVDDNALQKVKESPALRDIMVCRDYKKLLEVRELEAVFVFTPQYNHRDITVLAFEAGKSVYCDKPMALTVRECNEMIEASKKAGKVLMIGQQMRYHAHLNKMKEIIDRDEIGKPVMVWLNEFRGPFPKKWAFDREKSGGLFVEKNCHHFDFFNWFIGSKPVRVFASGNQDVLHHIFGVSSNILDNAWTIVDYESGARAMLGICMFAGVRDQDGSNTGIHLREIGVMGDKGMVRTEGFDLGKSVEVRFAGNKDRVVHEINAEADIPTPYNGEGNRGILIRFAQCVRENIVPETSGEIGRMAVAVSLAARKSAEENKIVKLSEG